MNYIHEKKRCLKFLISKEMPLAPLSILLAFLLYSPCASYLEGAYTSGTSTSGNANNALSHRLQVCETEIDMLKRNIESQEESREALDRDVKKLLKATKESSKESSQEALKKASDVEKQMDRLVADIKELKNHSNELSKSINELTKSLDAIRENESAHSKAIQSLEKAMRSLTLALKGKKGLSEASSISNSAHDSSSHGRSIVHYTVRSGDSLEKIARAHKMSLQTLTELNNLSTTTIRKGQELKVYSIDND